MTRLSREDKTAMLDELEDALEVFSKIKTIESAEEALELLNELGDAIETQKETLENLIQEEETKKQDEETGEYWED